MASWPYFFSPLVSMKPAFSHISYHTTQWPDRDYYFSGFVLRIDAMTLWDAPMWSFGDLYDQSTTRKALTS